MHRVFCFLILLVMSFLALSQASETGPAAPIQDNQASLNLIDDAKLQAYVDGLMAAYQAEHAAPGYTVSVVRSDRLVLAKGYGFADIKEQIPVDPAATRFHVASISKTFVWTAAMILVDRGQLDLDTDVNQYLKDYKVPEGETELTLNMLMAHRSGVEESFRVWLPEIAKLSLQEAIAATEPAQVFPRGERAAYSNWGSNLVALIVQDVSGQTYEEFLYSEILNPLGMTTTVLNENSPNADDSNSFISKNYRVKNFGPKEVEQLDMGSFAPIGGMTTTAVDMATWMRFHLNDGELNGVRLMGESTYALMRTRAYDPVPGSGGRAHGFGDIPYRDTSYYGHSGSINSFLSYFIMSKEMDIGIFISQNTSDTFKPLIGLPTLVMDRELATQDAKHPLLRPTPSEEDIEAAEELAGKYISNRRIYTGFDRLFALMNQPLSISADEGLLITGNSKAPYNRISTDLWENRLGDRIGVVRGESGEIVRLITPSGASDMEPISFSTNPMFLVLCVVFTVVFSVTSWLGLWRRYGHVTEANSTGKWMSRFALTGILPLLLLVVLAMNIPSPEEVSFAEIFVAWPPPAVNNMVIACSFVAIFGFITLIGAIPVWRKTEWKLIRKIHYSLFALSYTSLSLMLMKWGLAGYLPFVS